MLLLLACLFFLRSQDGGNFSWETTLIIKAMTPHNSSLKSSSKHWVEMLDQLRPQSFLICQFQSVSFLQTWSREQLLSHLETVNSYSRWCVICHWSIQVATVLPTYQTILGWTAFYLLKRLESIQMAEGAESILYAFQIMQTFCLTCRSPEVQYF